MSIAQLQLPGQIQAPNVDWSLLTQIGSQIGNAFGERRRRDELGAALSGLVDTAPENGTSLANVGTANPSMPTPQSNVPRGVRNNNPGNIKDSPFAKSMPGYAGNEGEFAKFETPEHGLGAMDALLTS